MYPECRHIRPGGSVCNSPAVKGSYWCYFHGRLHARQTIRHTHRLPDGRFASQAEIIDYGTYPVADPASGTRCETPGAIQSAALELPPIEDAASIQLALIDILQALAANRLDPNRAGLLLYGLQVASVNVKNTLSHGDVRTISHAEDGTPLAPQTYGYDVEDFAGLEEADDE
jgi:hypothetical protein